MSGRGGHHVTAWCVCRDRKRTSAYCHPPYVSSCVRRFCRSVPDSFSFCSFSFFVFYDAFAVTIHLRLPEYFCLFVCFFAFYQFSFSRHWVVALLHQQNYHQTGRQTEAVSLQLPFFFVLFTLRTSVLSTVFSTDSRVERRNQGQTGRKAGGTVSSSKLRYSLVFTRERLTNGRLGSAFPWARTSPAAPSRRGDG